MNLKNLINHKQIKDLDINELNTLAIDIKNEIINSVKNNGGHLASSLGAVKLILALFKVFDIDKDRIIFDIGHQAYAYKILTGRLDDFRHNRNKNGTSAFPRLEESKYDHSSPGHAGSSLSIANGYSVSDMLNNNDSTNITIIGDGSLTNGMAYEALNITKFINKKQIIIINNNSISITKNVGSFADEIKRIKKEKDPEFMHYGLKLLGPIDGTNIEELVKYYKIAKESKETVVLHVITKKGEGHEDAENDPIKFHGLSNEKQKSSFSKKASEVVYSMLKDKNIPVITPAMILGSQLSQIEKDYKNLLFDVGIAEESAVSFASGISLGGTKPILFIYSTFLQRAIDQIINDIYLQNQNVLFIVDRAGIVPNDGATHQGIYDLALLKVFSSFNILNPINFNELESMIKDEYLLNKTSFIRMPKIDDILNDYKYEKHNNFRYFETKKDTKLKVLALSPSLIKNALIAREKLRKINIDFDIISPISLNRLEINEINELKNTKKIIVFEEFIKNGGYSEVISDAYLNNKDMPQIIKHQIDKQISSESLEDILKHLGFDSESMFESIKKEYESSNLY